MVLVLSLERLRDCVQACDLQCEGLTNKNMAIISHYKSQDRPQSRSLVKKKLYVLV